MRKVILILFLFFYIAINAQVFWTETFNNGCAAGCLANGVNTGNGAWSVVSLAGDANPVVGDLPNQWYISCAENGHTNGVCGTGCQPLSAVATLASLHLGSTSIGDTGSAYDAGGLCGIFWCTNTHKRAESPVINCTGKSGISLNFNYIEYGQSTTDDATVWYFNGTVWALLANPNKTPCCGGSCNPGPLQGQWTATTIPLPASANNNPNVKIGFDWINNDDGLGNDPSFAVDDIKLSVPVLPIELTDFSYSSLLNVTILNWETLTEKNSDYFEILKSEDGIFFNSLGTVKAVGNSNKSKKYSFTDDKISNSIAYYKLKMVDLDQSFDYSPLIAVDASNSLGIKNNCFLNKNSEIEIGNDYVLVNEFETISIYDVDGKMIGNYTLNDYKKDNKIFIPVQNLNQGIYLAQLKGPSSAKSHKIFVH